MKKFLFTICALFATSSTFATNTFSIEKVYASVSGISTVAVNFSLDPGFECGGFSFDLQLPAEFEFVGKNAYTPGDCYASTPTFTTNLSGGVLKVAFATSDPLTKQSGTLASFQIRSKSAAAGTTYSGGLLTSAKFVDNSTSLPDAAADAAFEVEATAKIVLDEASTAMPAAQTGANVLVKRTVKKDIWNTICLPFGMDAATIESIFGTGTKMATYDTFAKGSDGNFTMSFVTYDWSDPSVDWMDANTPYIIKPTKDVNEFSVDDVEISSDYDALTYSKTVKGKKSTFTGTLNAGYVLPANYLFISGNKFYYSTGTTSIKGFRGYFYLQEFTASSPAPLIVVDGETTRINELNVVDGDGRIYNLKGQHVENPTEKGVYIKNGKKFVVK